jgi:hypothetical protein
MSKFIALLQFLLMLCGCSIGGTTYSDRVSIDGRDTLHSRARLLAGVANFDCMTSASGRCHYTLFASEAADDCNGGMAEAGATRQCPPKPLKQFAVPAGDSREFTGLPGFRLCVAVDDLPRDAQCKVPAAPPATLPDPRLASAPSG